MGHDWPGADPGERAHYPSTPQPVTAARLLLRAGIGNPPLGPEATAQALGDSKSPACTEPPPEADPGNDIDFQPSPVCALVANRRATQPRNVLGTFFRVTAVAGVTRRCPLTRSRAVGHDGKPSLLLYGEWLRPPAPPARCPWSAQKGARDARGVRRRGFAERARVLVATGERARLRRPQPPSSSA